MIPGEPEDEYVTKSFLKLSRSRHDDGSDSLFIQRKVRVRSELHRSYIGVILGFPFRKIRVE